MDQRAVVNPHYSSKAAAILRDLGYEVFYLNPLGYVFDADVSFPDIKRAFLEFVREALAENALGRIAWAVFDFVNRVLSVRRGKDSRDRG